MSKLKELSLHPYLLAVYAVFGLLIPNFEQVELKVIIRPLIFSVGFMLVCSSLFFFVFRSRGKANVFSTFTGILLFSYGHVYAALKSIELFDVFLFRHRTLMPLWIVILVVGIILIGRLRDLSTADYYLTVVFTFLVGISAVQLTLLGFDNVRVTLGGDAENQQKTVARTSDPDIYYIVLDSYGREDLLLDAMEYDNSSFISDLEELGFYVADCSQSNYAQTQLSLGSTLNFNYLDILAAEGGKDTDEALNTSSLIKQSLVRRFLEDRGYVTIAFETGFNFTQIKDADLYLESKPGRQLNEFEYLFLQTTAIRIYLDYQLGKVEDLNVELSRERTRFALEKLATIHNDPRPKFVFAHLLPPHPPFVFGPSGETTQMGPWRRDDEFFPDEYLAGYTGQVTYINRRLVELLRTIIEESNRPVIIILQGDHGPGLYGAEARMGILNAYYLPEHEYDNFYDSITPVNSFRVLFNLYFGQNLPLLEDVSRYSYYGRPYEYQIVENSCNR